MWLLAWRLYGGCVESENNKRNGWHTSIDKNLRMYGNDKRIGNCYKFEGEAFANLGNMKNLFDEILEEKMYVNW